MLKSGPCRVCIRLTERMAMSWIGRLWSRGSILAALMLAACGGVIGAVATAQSASAPAQVLPSSVPDAPGHATSDAAQGRIYGTVTDPQGNVVAGARVALDHVAAKAQQASLTDAYGAFTFSDLAAGAYQITIAAKGFAIWTGPVTQLAAGQYYRMPDIELAVAPVDADVNVVFTRHDEAEAEIKGQEEQRILGVLPNFYTSYVWRAAPMTSGQKFRLAMRTSIDPVTFAIAGATAGIEQGTNSFSGYGQGAAGYGKRFAASYADDVVDTFIGSAILPSMLHQDPRYFYKGVGGVSSRAFYAISTVVMCRGDNGRWQPNYSNVAGNLISAGISNLYYPASNRNGAGVTIDNALISTAEGAVSALLQEFLFKKISHGVPRSGLAAQPSAKPD